MMSTPTKPNTELHPFEAQLTQSWPPESWCGVSVVVAVSGGPDSVALVRAMAMIRKRFLAGQDLGQTSGVLILAHVHHGLRGEDADADADWVHALAKRVDLPCIIRRVDTPATSQADGDGVEAAARKLRYQALRDIAHEAGARYVAVAHTADDQVETVLHRLVRGTGVAGLAGMPRARKLSRAVTLIRPLLEIRREELTGYLTSLRQDFRIDATNADHSLTRARIRHALLPQLLSEFNPQAAEAILRMSHLAGEANEVLEKFADELAESAAEQVGDPSTEGKTIRLRRDVLSGQPPYLVRQAMVCLWKRYGLPRQAMGYEQWRRLAEFATGEAIETAITLPGAVHASMEGDRLVLRAPSLADENIEEDKASPQ